MNKESNQQDPNTIVDTLNIDKQEPSQRYEPQSHNNGNTTRTQTSQNKDEN